ncbi:YkvA family protein [Bordetella bronchialis]|uniref:DUF1232 domain-containing protein n=1 Tax=Bordetella bronchialis TaxID=463025 RepID=A0A193FLD6_9BORD|nr:YkvA family protein [Bordetella bronchialis]ANN68053.1 hypothetical protein BAU06_18705 [Bordetella bronchialis]ANN73144.1 hypothetical protein BAU08_18945 [Bordetella bronchialis]
MGWLKITRLWALRTRQDAMAVWYAMRNPATPWYAKALAILVAAYILSPIDLIPDFIPVLGLLDDIVLVPILIWATMRALPAPVRAESRERAQAWSARRLAKPRSRAGAIFVVLVWIAIAAAIALWLHAAWFSPGVPGGAA